MDKVKAFISKNNPLMLDEKDGERFSYNYFLPHYWHIWLAIFFSFILTFMPGFIRNMLGVFLGFVIYKTNAKRKNIVQTNLKLCFKDKDEIDIETITKNYFKNLGVAYLNLPMLWWKKDDSLQNVCSVENMQYIESELSKGKGIILFTAHTVSLDFGGRSISKFPIVSMYKPFRNKLLNWFIGKSRSKSTDNVVVFPRAQYSLKKIISALHKPVIFYYVADEDLGARDSIFVNFFNEPKATLTSISKLASLTNTTVIPCINHYCVKSKKYITYIDKPLENFPSNNIQSDLEQVNKRLEELIRRNIDQYMWSLRIFQTRPSNSKYPYKTQ